MKKAVEPREGAEFRRQFGFSAAVESSPFVFVSGQIGSEADGGISSDPGVQFERAFENLRAVLGHAGLGFDDVVELTTYHVGLREHIETFARVKSAFVEHPFPAWTAVGVVELALPGALAEISAVARGR